MDALPKQTIDKSGNIIHYSVGAIIVREGKYLLIDRAISPFGFAAIAGHVDEGEGPETALLREVAEESGLKVVNFTLLGEELNIIDNITCSRGVARHYWYFYLCEVTGDIIWNKDESKSINWYSVDQIKQLTLEPVWEYWFKKRGII